MRIAIVDDLKTERALLKERLSQQLALRGVEADILGFESGEAFLAAEKERRFSAAFLDIYMEGLSGMDAAKELRKTDVYKRQSSNSVISPLSVVTSLAIFS